MLEGARAAVRAVRRRPQARRGHVRRAAAGGRDRARHGAGRAAGLLLVVGSSLGVYPVADLPQRTMDTGGKLAIVNREPTPFDDEAALVLHAGAGEMLSAVCHSLVS